MKHFRESQHPKLVRPKNLPFWIHKPLVVRGFACTSRRWLGRAMATKTALHLVACPATRTIPTDADSPEPRVRPNPRPRLPGTERPPFDLHFASSTTWGGQLFCRQGQGRTIIITLNHSPLHDPAPAAGEEHLEPFGLLRQERCRHHRLFRSLGPRPDGPGRRLELPRRPAGRPVPCTMGRPSSSPRKPQDFGQKQHEPAGFGAEEPGVHPVSSSMGSH
jgi:hypothetical protein